MLLFEEQMNLFKMSPREEKESQLVSRNAEQIN